MRALGLGWGALGPGLQAEAAVSWEPRGWLPAQLCPPSPYPPLGLRVESLEAIGSPKPILTQATQRSRWDTTELASSCLSPALACRSHG